MRSMLQLVLIRIFLSIFAVVILTSCVEKEAQLFIFKRYNSEIENWDYYKTDLYNPSYTEKINIIPCVEGNDSFQPMWSPNGNYYVCSAAYKQPLIIYNINNEVMAKLEQGDPNDPLIWFFMGWSPDSQYASIVSSGAKRQPYINFSIMKYNGSGLHQFNKQTNASLMEAIWSPNGKLIAHQMYTTEHDYIIIYQSTGKEVSRFDLSKHIHANVVMAENLIWSPDSKKLAFIHAYNNGSLNTKLYILDIETGKLTDIILDKSVCIMNISDWSPDRQKILFDAIDCEKHISGDFDTVYYSINADGSELKPLTEKGLGSLNWTLDGESIIVNGYGNDISDKGMYIMNTDGSNKRILLDNGYFVSWITP